MELVLLFILGACIGSYLCCQVRRLHLKNSHQPTPKPSKEPSHKTAKSSAKTTKPTAKGTNKAKLPPRSICLDCKYQLAWYDNIPIISWLALRGKCRKCHHKIGLAEFLSELGVGLAFLAFGFSLKYGLSSAISVGPTPLFWVYFSAMLIFISIISFLAIYDGLYGELPTLCLTIAITCAIIIICLKDWLILSISSFTPNLIWGPLAAIAILGGLYLILYLISKGKWVGDGDWLLGTALGIALGAPWPAFLTLFLANLLACLIMTPAVFRKSKTKIYFGPFLVMSFIIVYSFCGIITI